MRVISDELAALIGDAMEKATQCLMQTEKDYAALAARYDDAMKRINDMQAELEHLRREVSRG